MILICQSTPFLCYYHFSAFQILQCITHLELLQLIGTGVKPRYINTKGPGAIPNIGNIAGAGGPQGHAPSQDFINGK